MRANRISQSKVLFFLLLFVFAAIPAHAEFKETLSYKSYQVKHQQGMSLLQALNKASPVRHRGKIFHGYTRWNINWQYFWYEEPQGQCYLTKNITTLTAEITLPELHSSDAQAQVRFYDYLSPLRQHELGHYEIARKAARAVDAAIITLPAMNSCAGLKAAADRRAQEIITRAKEEEKTYDQVTAHGRTQGAWLSD